MCTWYGSFNLQSFLPAHITITYIHGVVLPLTSSPTPLAPLAIPFTPLAIPFVLPFTYLAPSSCDRNRPPSYQVACRLTPFAPPFTRLSHSFQLPRTPIAPRLTTTTLGLLRSHCAEQLWLFPNTKPAEEKFARQINFQVEMFSRFSPLQTSLVKFGGACKNMKVIKVTYSRLGLCTYFENKPNSPL